MKSNLSARLALLSLVLLPVCASDTLSALGRVLPRSGIVELHGPAGDTVQAVNTREGDWVEPGQSLATLASAPAARARQQQAEAELAATRLNNERDVAMAQGQIATAELEVKYALNRFDRIMAAGNSEFISPDQIESRTLGKQQAEIKLAQAMQNLARVKVEPGRSLRAAEAEVEAARAVVATAEVRAPLKAQVLKIRARPGAPADRGSLFQLGDTAGMIVVAEVYEADVLKVKPGQKVTVSSAALPKKMTGTVTSVSSMIARNALESIDPNESSQSRIVEVTVQMDETSPLDRLVLLQVDVTITL